MSYALGVDLGTTYTAAALNVDGKTSMFTLGNHAIAVPSAVYVQPGGSFAFGEVALQRGRLDPDGLAVEFKRRIGDMEPLRLHGTPYAPEQLSARMLGWVLEQVGQTEGGAPSTTVITHPANWGAFRLEQLDEIARLAGLRSYGRISEPEAAALFYASQTRVPAGTLLAVYDLGGGTFDATVLHKLEDRFEIVGVPDGVDRLGGIDFDDVIVEFVKRSLPAGLLDDLDPDDARILRDLGRLRLDCIEAKEALSNDPEAVVPISLGDHRGEVRVTRREFEQAIDPLVQLTVDALARAIESSGSPVDAVSSILLVGGSSRIPLVSRILASTFGRPIAVDAHPKHATALGAALFTPTAVSSDTGDLPRLGTSPAPAPSVAAASRFSAGSTPVVVSDQSGIRRTRIADADPVSHGGNKGPLPHEHDAPLTPRLEPAARAEPAPAEPPPPRPAPGPPPLAEESVLAPTRPGPDAPLPAEPRSPSPAPSPEIAVSSPVAPLDRWGGETAVSGRGMRIGTDGRLYSEQHAAENAERARQAQHAAAQAQALANRRLRLALLGGIAVVALLVVLVLLTLG